MIIVCLDLLNLRRPFQQLQVYSIIISDPKVISFRTSLPILVFYTYAIDINAPH